MTNTENFDDLEGQTASDASGAKIGKIGQVYVDDESGQPLWVTIATGLFGNKETFAPLYGSTVTGNGLQLAVTKDMVKDAPSVEPDGHISDEEDDALYRYYDGYLGATPQAASGQTGYAEGAQGYQGQQYTEATQGHEDQHEAEATRDDLAGREDVQGGDTSGLTTGDAMTRSEERLHVGTEQVQGGRARLRKRVVTEHVSQTIPVSHEEVRLEREPITDANRDEALSGADITEDEHEVTLHAEQPVVAKETVPVERVRLGKETVTEDHEVNETLRKEQIDDPETDTGVDTRAETDR